MDELSDSRFVVIDDFLSDDLYQTIRNLFISKLDEFEQAGIGALDQNLIQKNIRGDQTYWLDSKRDENLQDWWSLVNETIETLNRTCFLSISGFEFHLAHYPPGGHYEKHLDQFSNRDNRLISMVIYLNEGWQKGDGGELEIYLDDAAYLVEPHKKRCVLFQSAEVPHAVLEANKSRYSLTGWLLYRPAALGKFI
ncbi:MAG: 2OG-Fe(II) oxygenase [Crocinitomicaceae bacterium]|nr:2OG-Fe(II) oxygenase [Crocinitomicaceae bacterium]